MATTFRYLNFEYEVIDSQKNEVALIDASHATGTITIPSEVECNGRKFKVTKISGKRVEYWYQPDDRRRKKECRNEFRGAFQGKDYISYSGRWTDSSSIIEVIIPNSVTTIGDRAFSFCEKLTSITIPNSVTTIGNSAFCDCKSLTSITIPNSVTSIGGGAFRACKSLTSITIPNGVTSIGYDTFLSCHSLTSITIPNNVTTIGDRAFSFCKKLISITIPSSVTSVGDDAFYYCEKLTSITIENEKGKVKIKDDAFPYSAKINYVGKPKEQPAKPIENPYHQAILEVEKATAKQATATKAAEKTTVNVQTTPEPSQPVSPTTTQTRNRDKADYVFNGKKVNHGVWTLEIADDKSVEIYKNGEPCKKTSPALRELAAEIGFTYDPKWNTRQLGGKLFAQLIKLT